MRLWHLSILAGWLVLVGAVALPVTTSTRSFNLQPQKHVMLLEGAPAYSYGTTWSVELPAPTSRPSRVNVRELSTFVYKYAVKSLSSKEVEGEFHGITWTTSFWLEDVFLGSIETSRVDLPWVVEPGGWWWGPGRPKIVQKAAGSVSEQGPFPVPKEGETWTLRVEAISHFSLHSSGQIMFSEVLRQRVKGTVRYVY